MVERDAALTAILKAAADPTRRRILTLLAQEGPLRVTALAGRFEISLNAVSRHIRVLEEAGLVSRRTEWREHLIAIEIDRLAEVDRWFDDLRSIWSLRLDRLSDIMKEDTT